MSDWSRRSVVRVVLIIPTIIVLTYFEALLPFGVVFFTWLFLPPLMAYMAGRYALLYGTATNLMYWLWLLGWNAWDRTALYRVKGEWDDGWYFEVYWNGEDGQHQMNTLIGTVVSS